MSGQDFTTVFTSGVTQSQWQDIARPAGTIDANDPGAPSRINPHIGRPHLRYMGVVGTQVQITATVDGVAGESDANLGGRLFTAWAIEHPQPAPLAWTTPAGQSSVQRFTPTTAGHYGIAMKREAGGMVILHLDVEAP